MSRFVRVGTLDPSDGEHVTDVAVDGEGNVVVAATLGDAITAKDVHVLRLDGNSGNAVASHRLDGGSLGNDAANAVAPGRNGRIAVAAEVTGAGSIGTDFAVLLVADRLAGKALVLRETAGRSKLALRVKDPAVFASTPGGAGDPTLDGAVLELRNPLTAETATIALPAPLWRAKSGSRPGVLTYKYADKPLAAGPCRTAVVKSGRLLKAKCLGLGGFTLDEPAQGTLDVRLTLGTGGGAHCLRFGGVAVDVPGRFTARNATPPTACD